ncbi:MAG TPA: hypothetical protein VLN49_07820, partial [Gemmatimonadaceae bacterium]|nr:hypothetical protein [Gemmatimonadaceae bacterium]
TRATPVAAMIGPAQVQTGSTVVTRTVETVEGADGAMPLRVRLEDAVMRLELVPRYLGAPGGLQRRSPRRDEMEPAAVYALTPLVSLASYEVCAGPPTVRYLRRDAHGRIEKDAMLYSASTPK